MDYRRDRSPRSPPDPKKNGPAIAGFLVNMLKAFYGDAATPGERLRLRWLPKRNAAKNYGHAVDLEDALAGR
jgi:hypothetical protein